MLSRAAAVLQTLARQWLRGAWRASASPSLRFPRLIASLLLIGGSAYLGFSFQQAAPALGPLVPQVALGSDDVLGMRGAAPLLHRSLLPVLLMSLLPRFFFEGAPQFSTQPCLTLPIPRGTLASFVAGIALWSRFNLCWGAFVIAASAGYVFPLHGIEGAALYTVGGLLAASTATHVLLLGKRAFARRPMRFSLGAALAAIGLASAAAALPQQAGRAAFVASAWLFEALAGGRWAALVPLGVSSIGAAMVLRESVRSGLYLGTAKTSIPGRFGILSARLRDTVGSRVAALSSPLALLHLRLLLRNRLPKAMLLASPAMCTFVLLLYLSPEMFAETWPLAGVFASGAFLLNPGQHLLNMHAAGYDALLAYPVSPERYARSVLRLLQASCAAAFLLSLPVFLFWRPDLLFFSTCFLLYNAGVGAGIVSLAAALSSGKRLNLWRGVFLNYETLSVSRLLYMLPVFALPYGLWQVAGDPLLAQGALGVLGGAGLAATPLWARLLAAVLKKRRHAMARGFRG